MADLTDASTTPKRQAPVEALEEPKTVKKHMSEQSFDWSSQPLPPYSKEWDSMGKLTDLGLMKLCSYFEMGAPTGYICAALRLSDTTVKRRRREWTASQKQRLVTTKAVAPPVPRDVIAIRRKHIEELILQKDEDGYPVFGNSVQTLAEELKKQHDIDVTRQTVYNDLEALGFRSVARPTTVVFGEGDAEKRLKWVNETDFPLPQHMLFSDESWFRCGDGRVRQWVKDDEDPVPLEVEKRHSKLKLMIFGIIGFGVKKVIFIEENVTKEVYIEMLKTTLLPIIEKNPNLTFMQDNAPSHTAKIVREWFEAHNIRVLPWPARSPDMNPIEHFWAYFKKKVFSKKISEVAELKTAINAAFKKVPMRVINNLVMSFPKRCEALKIAEGGPIVNEYKKIENGEW